MTKRTPDSGEPAPEKESYTKDEVATMIREAQQRQLAADDIRVHGNAFFAEALDHIGTLAARDQFWKRVYQAGTLFKQQFEMNTGQVAPESFAKPPQPASKPAEKKPADTTANPDE